MDVCRFCLSDDNEQINPLLSPCLCAGTMKFVHRNCLTQWRTVAPFDRFRVNCQLCNTPYILQHRWLVENIPAPNHIWDNFLNQTFLITIFVHYIHLLVMSQYFYKFINPFQHIKSAFELNSGFSIFVFNSILCGVTLVYSAYYLFLIKNVINKRLYVYHISFYFLRYFGGCVIVLYFIQRTIFPFSILYVYLLSYFNTIHIQTLQKINTIGNF